MACSTSCKERDAVCNIQEISENSACRYKQEGFFGLAFEGNKLFCVWVEGSNLELKDPNAARPTEACCLLEPIDNIVHARSCACQREEGWSDKVGIVGADIISSLAGDLQRCHRPLCQGVIRAYVVAVGTRLQLYRDSHASSPAITEACGTAATNSSMPPCCSLAVDTCAEEHGPCCSSPACQDGPSVPPPRFLHLAWVLAGVTGLYCLAEGVLSVVFATLDKSISLGVFGADSLIEVASTAFVIWRLAGKGIPLSRERIATLCIGCLLILLFAAAVAASTAALLRHEHPESTTFNVIIGSISVLLLLLAWRAKLYVARQIRSPTLRADANCSFACVRLSLVLLAGGVIYKFVPAAWWVDAAAALVLSLFFLKEGIEGVQHALSKGFAGGCGCG